MSARRKPLSVVPPSLEDYDEAIRDLTDARAQLASGDFSNGCAYCGSDDHTPNACRHNPLVTARRIQEERDSEYWRCYHCRASFGFNDLVAARNHFGSVDTISAVCNPNSTWSRRLLQACEELRSLRTTWPEYPGSKYACEFFVAATANEEAPFEYVGGSPTCIDAYSLDQREQMCPHCNDLLDFRSEIRPVRRAQRAIVVRIVTAARRMNLQRILREVSV